MEEVLPPDKKTETRDVVLREMFHRIQNTLQTLVSYVNIMFGQRESISREDTKKLLGFIHGLNTLQGLSLQQLRDGKQYIEAREFMKSIADHYSKIKPIELGELGSFHGTHRQVSALGSILNELLDNAVRHGEGPIQVVLGTTAQGDLYLKVTNRTRGAGSPNQSFQLGTGLRLVQLLAESQLGLLPEIRYTADESGEVRFEALIPLPSNTDVAA